MVISIGNALKTSGQIVWSFTVKKLHLQMVLVLTVSPVEIPLGFIKVHKLRSDGLLQLVF